MGLKGWVGCLQSLSRSRRAEGSRGRHGSMGTAQAKGMVEKNDGRGVGKCEAGCA